MKRKIVATIILVFICMPYVFAGTEGGMKGKERTFFFTRFLKRVIASDKRSGGKEPELPWEWKLEEEEKLKNEEVRPGG